MLFRFAVTLLAFIVNTPVSLAQLEKDPKATEILKGVSQKYRSYKAVTSDFKIVIEDIKTKTKETQKGTISILGSKYKLVLSDQEVISDGKTIWTYLKESNEVQINDQTAKPGSITPNNIFTLYENGFGSKYMGSKTTGGKTFQVIELVPEDTKKPYFKVQVNINKTEKQVSSARIFQKNGTFINYNIETFKAHNILPDSLFIFSKEKYPGVEIIDLR